MNLGVQLFFTSAFTWILLVSGRKHVETKYENAKHPVLGFELCKPCQWICEMRLGGFCLVILFAFMSFYAQHHSNVHWYAQKRHMEEGCFHENVSLPQGHSMESIVTFTTLW